LIRLEVSGFAVEIDPNSIVFFVDRKRPAFKNIRRSAGWQVLPGAGPDFEGVFYGL